VTKSTRKASANQTRMNQILMVIGAVVVLIFGCYYLVSGKDPLGLFEPGEETPVASAPLPDTVGSGGDWWQVYFTDPKNVDDDSNLAGSIPEKLIGYINDAKSTIHIASFEFNLTPVAEALIVAHKRGVEVLWVTDDEYGIDADEEDDHGQFAMLERAGIEIRDDARGALMHNKFWIFDGQIVWTGSTNITTNGNFRNNNNVIVLRSTKVAKIYEREFEELWAGESGPTSPSTVDQQSVTIDGTPVQILFAAEDEVASHLVPMLEGAKKSIRFMAFSFTHNGIGDAVLARAGAGIDVKGIFETRGSETEYSEMPILYCAGVPVRQDGNPGMFHHKVFVIDDKMVVTGSFNFSDNANESNDENVVIVANDDIAALYLREFERRWREAQAPDKADMNCQ
jgi:phosphatidylserine/phosphatidylglycerophosphate/cardiolipin synthase-like enzyme